MASPLPGSGFWAGRHDTKQPPSWSAGGHGATSMCHDAPGLIPPAVLPSAKWHWIRPAVPTPLLSRIGLVGCSRRPQRAERTPRRLRRDHRLVVDAEIAAADNRSRPAAGPRTDAVLLSHLPGGRPVGRCDKVCLGPAERLAEEVQVYLSL